MVSRSGEILAGNGKDLEPWYRSETGTSGNVSTMRCAFTKSKVVFSVRMIQAKRSFQALTF